MIVVCKTCLYYYDDAFRQLHCPHPVYERVNEDKLTHFKKFDDSWLSVKPPDLSYTMLQQGNKNNVGE